MRIVKRAYEFILSEEEIHDYLCLSNTKIKGGIEKEGCNYQLALAVLGYIFNHTTLFNNGISANALYQVIAPQGTKREKLLQSNAAGYWDGAGKEIHKVVEDAAKNIIPTPRFKKKP